MNTMTAETIWTTIVDLLRVNGEASEAFIFDCLSMRGYLECEAETVIGYLIDNEFVRSTMISRDVPGLTLVTVDFLNAVRAAA